MSLIDREYTEKRDFIRMRLNAPANIEFNGEQQKAVCRDLSAQGMLIDTDHPFVIGDQFHVHLPAFTKGFSPFSAFVEVTRLADEVNQGFIGVKILEMLD